MRKIFLNTVQNTIMTEQKMRLKQKQEQLYLKVKQIHVKIVIVGGIVGAIIGALFAQKIESENLKKYFGIFLLIAVMEIYNFLKENILNKNTHTKGNEKNKGR